MSAYGCCGEYNEHSERCITNKYDLALKLVEEARQLMPFSGNEQWFEILALLDSLRAPPNPTKDAP